MTVKDNNGPAAPYPGPAYKDSDAAKGPDAGLEKAESEPKQGTDEAEAKKNRADWTPPPGNPGSDQDALTDRDEGSAKTE